MITNIWGLYVFYLIPTFIAGAAIGGLAVWALARSYVRKVRK